MNRRHSVIIGRILQVISFVMAFTVIGYELIVRPANTSDHVIVLFVLVVVFVILLVIGFRLVEGEWRIGTIMDAPDFFV